MGRYKPRLVDDNGKARLYYLDSKLYSQKANKKGTFNIGTLQNIAALQQLDRPIICFNILGREQYYDNIPKTVNGAIEGIEEEYWVRWPEQYSDLKISRTELSKLPKTDSRDWSDKKLGRLVFVLNHSRPRWFAPQESQMYYKDPTSYILDESNMGIRLGYMNNTQKFDMWNFGTTGVILNTPEEFYSPLNEFKALESFFSFHIKPLLYVDEFTGAINLDNVNSCESLENLIKQNIAKNPREFWRTIRAYHESEFSWFGLDSLFPNPVERLERLRRFDANYFPGEFVLARAGIKRMSEWLKALKK